MVSTITTIISLCIAAASLIYTFTRNSRKDTHQETKENVEIHAGLQSQIDILSNTISPRLDTIDDGIRDLKADGRSTRGEISKIRDEFHDEIRRLREDMHSELDDVRSSAQHAVELAEAAHRRLDRTGVDPDILVQRL